jgi:hypothetical protein
MSQKRDAPVISTSGGETTIRFDSARSARISLTLDLSGGLTIATTVDDAASEQEAPVPSPSPRLLPAQDRHQVLVAWNATETAIPRLCTHHVFEEQVAATPDGVNPNYQTTSKINDLHLDNTRSQIRWEVHIPGWNASAWHCRHHQCIGQYWLMLPQRSGIASGRPPLVSRF